MKNRWKQYTQWWNKHEEEAFIVGATGIAITLGLLVGCKIARSHDVMWVDQLLYEGETVGMYVHLRNGRTRPFCNKRNDVSKGGA